MPSLANNLGIGRSRKRNDTFFIIGIIIFIFAIVITVYVMTRDDEEKKKTTDDTPELPTVSNVGVKRTLNPDSRGSESGTSETYEIDGGKLETYQIEYNTGETFSDLERKLLSRNIDLTVSWNNGMGFDNVTEIIFKRKIDGTVKRTISYTKSDYSSGDDILNYFKSNQQNLSLEFDNIDNDGNMYNVVGNNTVAIFVKLPNDDNDYQIWPGDNTDIPVTIGITDLSSTLEITGSRSQMYYPVTSGFSMSDLDISNDEYTITPSLPDSGTQVPFSQLLKSACDGTLLTDDINFHFTMPDSNVPSNFKIKMAKDDDEWVKVCSSTNELAVTSVSSEASTFEMVTSDKQADSGQYNKFLIKSDPDLFMYVKHDNAKNPVSLYMGAITDMDVEEYTSMDMLIELEDDSSN